jgi:hypothetical protein
MLSQYFLGNKIGDLIFRLPDVYTRVDNHLNSELNSICKSKLAKLLWGVFKLCACFLKNLTKCLHKNMTQVAFHYLFNHVTK